MATGSQDTTAAMFGVLFVGGGIYGAYTIWTEARDQVIALDADPNTGRAAITLWRPFKNMVIDLPIDRLTGWRHWVKVGKRNMRTHFVVFNAEGYPQPLYVELTKGEMPEGFRELVASGCRGVRGEHRQTAGIGRPKPRSPLPAESGRSTRRPPGSSARGPGVAAASARRPGLRPFRRR